MLLPSWRQFQRVQTILDDDPALRLCLSARTHEVEKKTGEMLRFSPEAVQVAQAFFEGDKDAAKVPKRDILALAQRLLILKKTGPTTGEAGSAPAAAAAPTVTTNTSNGPVATETSNQNKCGNEAGVESGSTGPESSPTQAPVPAAEATQKIEIVCGDAKGVYTVHPVACMFPPMRGRGYDELLNSLKNDGQQEPCVVDGNVFLDGRNRVKALNELGRATRVVQFADLETDLTPGAWVMTKNLQRRHLTSDQYLAITAKYRAWCKEEADRKQAEADAASRSEQGASTDQDDPEKTEASQQQNAEGAEASDYRQKPADNTRKRKRGRPRGERSEAKALARDAKQSRYRAEQMVKLRKQSPELATKVEKGALTLKEAMRLLKAQQSAQKSQPQGPDDVNKVAKAVEKAKQMLLKQAKKLEPNEQAAFWQQLAEFSISQAEASQTSD
jgi:ParB-like chromosome segregation protein Spo0J